jgi:ferredoxin
MGQDLKNARYKVIIKRDLCIGAATCVAIAPNTYALDDENKAIVLDNAGDDPDEILLAAQGCPTTAIEIYDNLTGEKVYPK